MKVGSFIKRYLSWMERRCLMHSDRPLKGSVLLTYKQIFYWISRTDISLDDKKVAVYLYIYVLNR